MREADVEFIRSIFYSVMPDLVYPRNLREILEELLNEGTDILLNELRHGRGQTFHLFYSSGNVKN